MRTDAVFERQLSACEKVIDQLARNGRKFGERPDGQTKRLRSNLIQHPFDVRGARLVPFVALEECCEPMTVMFAQ